MRLLRSPLCCCRSASRALFFLLRAIQSGALSVSIIAPPDHASLHHRDERCRYIESCRKFHEKVKVGNRANTRLNTSNKSITLRSMHRLLRLRGRMRQLQGGRLLSESSENRRESCRSLIGVQTRVGSTDWPAVPVAVASAPWNGHTVVTATFSCLIALHISYRCIAINKVVFVA